MPPSSPPPDLRMADIHFPKSVAVARTVKRWLGAAIACADVLVLIVEGMQLARSGFATGAALTSGCIGVGHCTRHRARPI